MRINIHDCFKSWRDFTETTKALYRILQKYNTKIKSMVIYINLVDKDSNKAAQITNVENHNSIGIDIGYFDWAKNKCSTAPVLFFKDEDELMSQREYDSLIKRNTKNARAKSKIKEVNDND